MKPTIFSILALTAGLSTGVNALAPPKAQGGLIEATGKDFSELVKSQVPVLVKFVAPWCDHCKKLEPEYIKAAEQLSAEGIKLLTVDCTTEKEVCGKFDIRGYPTMKVFREGVEISKYPGARDSESIVKFMRKQVAPAITTVTDSDGLKKVRDSDNLVIVGFFEEKSEEGEVFQKAADKMRNDFTFARMDAAPAEYKGVKLMAFKKFDEPEVKFDGKFTEQALVEFVNGESIPLAAEIGPENYTKYIDSGLPLAYFFYADDKQKESYTKAVTAAAKTAKGKVNTVFINGGLYGQHAEVLNIEQKWPAFVIHDMSQDRDLKYPLPKGDKMSPESLTKFVESFMKGSLKPSFKSEPIPSAKDDKNAVRTLVHDNFEKVAFDKNKDVMVEIYAPWCGACKRIAPDYESLAKAIAAQTDKVILAKMDGVANDIPTALNFRLEHFPTFKLIKAGSNEVVTFDGALSYNELAAWLESNATTKFAVERVAEPETAADDDSEMDDDSSRDEL